MLWAHRLSVVTAIATLLLLVVGGTVNPTGSSLACPEAFVVCYGQLFPDLVGGVLYEHGHRLFAMSVGFLQIGLTLLLWRTRVWRGWGVALLGMVLLQGGLGALTVFLKLPWLVSTAHLVLGMSYFAALLYISMRTRLANASAPSALSAHWPRVFGDATASATPNAPASDAGPDRLAAHRVWFMVAAAAVLVQLILGALVRHNEAWLSCLGMPSCENGSYWSAFYKQQLHMVHRGFGIVVGIVTTLVAWRAWRDAPAGSSIRRLLVAAPLLVVLQIVLGIYTVLTLRSIPVAVGHFAGAALLWGTWVSIVVLASAHLRRVATADAKALIHASQPTAPKQHPALGGSA